MKKFDLQLFADGNNNDLSARDYQLEFKELLQAVFGASPTLGTSSAADWRPWTGCRRTNTLFT